MKLGVLLRDLGPTQLAFHFIQNANRWLVDHPRDDIIAFVERHIQPVIRPNFAQMPLLEAYQYDGVVIATNLATAAKLAHFPGPSARAFYSWDLEWLRLQQKEFRPLADIYRAKELQVITRSVDHALVLANAWNRSVAGIVDYFDIQKLVDITCS